MKRGILFIFLLTTCVCGAQDATFNNTHHSLVSMNPSFAGSNGHIRNQTGYRNQWPNLSGQYVTYGSCLDGYIKPLNGGVAMNVTSDDQARGTLRLTTISLAYAQFISIGNNLKIIPSIQAGYSQYTLDKGRLNFGDRVNARFNSIWYSSTVPESIVRYRDLSAGLLFKYGGNYIGVSCAHLAEPNISLFRDEVYKLPIKTIIHASHNGMMNTRTTSNVSCVVSTQGPYQSFSMRILNCYSERFLYGLGYGYFNSNEMALFFGFRAGGFTINYSYDVAISKLSGNTAGSHELSVSLAFKKKNAGRSPDLESR